MIEIKITIDSALALLLERMKFELRLRQKSGMISRGLRLEDLSYKELLPIVESSLFDTVWLLPLELITSETNLTQIITSSVRALSRVFKREEFTLYSERQVKNIILPVQKYLSLYTQTKQYSQN